MTKEEFVRRVVELVDRRELDKLEELYDEIMGYGKVMVPAETNTIGGQKVTITWGTP